MSDVDCPFCGSYDTELMSLFGQQLMSAQYYCRTCHTPFERVKGPEVAEDARDQMRGAERRHST